MILLISPLPSRCITEVTGLYLLQIHLVSFESLDKTYTGICSQLAKPINSVVVAHDPCIFNSLQCFSNGLQKISVIFEK